YANQTTRPDMSVSSRDYFKRAMQSKDIVWADILIASTDHQPIATVAAQMKDKNGGVLGVASLALNVGNIAEISQSMKIGETGSLILVDSKGVPIVYPDKDVLAAGNPLTELPPVAEALRTGSGTMTYYNS